MKAVLNACITACEACAAECERHAEAHAHCRVCAEGVDGLRDQPAPAVGRG